MQNSNSKRKVGKKELITSCGCCSDGQRNEQWLWNIIDNCEQVTMSKKLQWQWAGGKREEKGKRAERAVIKGKYDYITWQILSNYIICLDLAPEKLKWTWLSLQHMSRVTTRLNAIYYFAVVKGTEKNNWYWKTGQVTYEEFLYSCDFAIYILYFEQY